MNHRKTVLGARSLNTALLALNVSAWLHAATSVVHVVA